MKNIIYLAIDRVSILKEIEVSILSLLNVAKDNLEDYNIYIYTNIENSKEYLNNLNSNINIIFKDFDYSIYKEKYNYNYIYNCKIIALINFLEEYNEPVIFIDGDTFFYKNPKNLFDYLQDNIVIMNYKEVVIEEYIMSLKKKSDIFCFCMDIMRKRKIIINEEEIIINKNYSLWNSGVIEVTPIFKAIRDTENIDYANMFKTFKKGTGMEIIVPNTNVALKIISMAESFGVNSKIIGYAERSNFDGNEVIIKHDDQTIEYRE